MDIHSFLTFINNLEKLRYTAVCDFVKLVCRNESISWKVPFAIGQHCLSGKLCFS